MDSNIKHLYDTMISRGYTGLGDFSNFEGKMKDSGKRKLVYDHLMQDDYFSEIGDFSKFESALGYSPVERKDYVSQSRANPAPIALRQEADVPMKDQSEYVNPWTNSPDYNFESLRKKGKIETATPPPPTEYEKDSSFMNSWVADFIQRTGGQGLNLLGGGFGFLDKAAKDVSNMGLGTYGGMFGDSAKLLKEAGQKLMDKGDRHKEKSFTDLWKEGDYTGSISNLFMEGGSMIIPQIAAAMATGGTSAASLMGASVYSDKLDQLDESNPDMPELAKRVNAISTSAFELLSEKLSLGPVVKWLKGVYNSKGKDVAQKELAGAIENMLGKAYKDAGLLFAPVWEGVTEAASQIAENITDKVTGADPDKNISDGVFEAFGYGVAGGAPIGLIGYGKNKYDNYKYNKMSSPEPSTNSSKTDQGVNTPPQFTKSIIDDAFEQGRNMSDKGDLRDLSLQMEASRTALTEKNPNLAIRMEQYIDNGASENQINEMLKGVDNETRELAYDFYINTQKIKGVEDKSIENINNEVDSYMSDNIIPYVSISPNGRQVISTATFKEGLENKKVYIRSINGDNVIISDNGNNRMVPMSSLSDIEENDVEQIRNSYRQQLLVTRQSELDMAMNHNPKTQLPKPGLVIWNGDNAFILQGQDENGDWIAQPAALDKETGQVAPKAGSAPAMPITERDILALQDAMYDSQQANEVSQDIDNVASVDSDITSVSPVSDTITLPTSEIETEGAIDQIAQPSNVEAPSMVMREDGTPDFVSSGTDMTLDFLYNKYGDKMPRKIEVTRKSFDESLKKASDALEKAQEAYDDAPIGKEDKVETALIKARQEYDAIKVEADFWANLDNRLKEESEKATATSGQVIDISEKEDTEPVDIKNEDVVTQESAPGGIKPIGKGVFGNIYDQFKGKFKEAISFLKQIKEGEAIAAIHHKDIGDISIVWGNEKAGLEKILRKHPEVVDNLQEIIDGMEIVQQSDNRIKLESKTHFAVISKEFQGEPRSNWLLTAYEKRDASDGSMDIDSEPVGKQNGTAPLQDISIRKDNVSSSENQANEVKSFVAPSPKESENPLDYAERIVEAKRLHDEELKVNTNPSEAQKEAGNYKKGHIKINGFDVTIEQPAGSVRSCKDANGKEWSVTMNNTYGYIRGTKGVDGDHIDVFLGPDMNSDMVYVVDQVNTDGSFDEHKVMIGFSSLEDARSAYLSNYEDGWQGLGNITGVALDEFKKWIDSSTRKTKSFSEYKGIKREEDIAPRKVKKLSLVDKDDYITSAERKHIKAFLESGLKEARVNNSIYEISNIGDDGVYEIVRRFNYTDPLTLVKDENGKLVNKRGEGEHVIRVKPTFEETRPDSGIRFRETRIIPEEENIIKKAKSDGSYMKAPNGNPTNLNEKQWVQVRTKAFKEWFGDWENNPEDASKVIDENGEPRVVYHGTYADFNAFDESHLGDVTNLNATNEDWAKTSHIGFWFNDNKIGFYTKHKPVFLNVRNPLEFASMESLVDEMSYYDSGEDFKRSNSDGYDSVIVLEDEEMGGRSYSVFNDNQIKSATENNGGFSSHNDDIRFREVKDKNGEKSLVGLHNISEEKLRKALRQGGFANPSAAVIDISRQSHTGYGSISLVLPSSMIEKRTGKNAGTWSQDAWTPIYPTIERQFSGKGSDAFSKDLQKLPEEMRSTTKSGMDSYMDGRGEDSLAYMYLYEQGKAPELARTKPSYPEKTRTEVEDATNGSFSMSGLSDKQLSRLKDAYMEYKGFSTEGYNEAIKLRRAKLEEAIGKMNPRSILYEKRKTDLERIDKYGFDYSAVESFMKSVRDDISNSDKVDAHGTMRDSWNFIEENGMRGDFNKWLDKLNERYGIKEIIFNGFTPSGIRKYIPNTLENVSKFMKKQGRSASVGIGASFQNFAASLLDAKGSLKDIRKDKGKLTTDHADVDAFRDKWSKVFHELGEKLQPDAKGYDDYGLYRLAEAARSKDPQKYIKEEYGIDFSDEDVKTLNEMVDAIRNEYPAMYFETKFERPVYLEEFAAAVVPDNVDDDIRKAIYDAGLKIFTYKADDEISRNEAVKQASEIDGVRFRSIGEKGAANLNKAETIEFSINDWSAKLNTPVRVIHGVDDITDTDENMLARKRDSKGWYDTSTGEIVIVSPNSTSVGDAQRTFLHEVVGHHGLRELFGDDFDTFLDNVYRNANEDIRENIIDRTKGNPLNLREATEEYIAELAERGFDNKVDRSLWEKIKDAFLDMLRKAGISLDFKLSDNDLRYILWRSYKNLEQGNLMDVAEDTVMRNDLGVGDFSVRFREAKTEVENEEPLNKEMVDAWDKVASSDSFKFKEAMVDSLTAIDEFLKLLAKKTKSKILDYENPYYALIALSSKNKADMDSFDSKFLNPLNEAIRALIGDVSEVSKKGLRRTWDWSKGPLRDLVKYVQSKHGIERNRDMSVRDGIETLKAFDVDALSKMGVISESDLKNAKKTAEKVAEEKGSEAYKKTYDKVLGKELKKGVDKGKAERSAEIAADYRQSFVKSEIYNKEMDKYKEKVTGTLIDRWEDSKKDILKKGLAWDEEQKELDREALSFQWKLGDNSYGVILGKDYSGLSSVFKPSEDGANKDKWLSDAYDFVRDYESTHNMVLVDNLWDKVHNVSEYTLRRQYESGLISKSYMDKNLSRFKYFIPLRGFSDNIASDVYDYIDATEIKMGNPVKTAKGRISEADNPFAGLIHVGYGSITAGNRNLAKQRFLNLASNHDTGGLITIDNIWVRNVGTEENPEWVESIPQIPDNASGEEVAKAVKDHEEMMRELREEGKAELIKGGRSDIPYKTLYDQRSQHQVQVFVGGNRYVMTVNGNPRLAQAVNGLTNPDVKDDLAYVVARNLKTFMAGAFTSKNVAFSFANLIRDTPYANNSVFVTENFRYFKDFSGNQRRALFGLRSLGRNLYKYKRGEIDISDKEQAIFKEFMDNGGATGYTFVETQKEYAKDLANKLEKLSDGNIGKLSPKELVSTVFECFEFMGNVAELVNRYAAYKTSREHGRSIDRSINDAKEVSVNFNKKGAGKKTKSDKWYINTAAWISEYGRDWVLFFNAAVQSMYKEYSMLRNHPIKGIGSRIAPLIFMGSSVSLLNNLFMPMLFAYLGWDSDDDDRDYFDSLSDHERQNNICIRLTHGRWLKIPLSPELANYFKIGDIIAGQLSGKREVEAMDVVKTGIDMVSPLNINWEYDSWKFALNLLPTVVQPIAQNASNVNFMGNPIYKTSMNKANDYDPEYTKVYRSTSTTMVELSRALNSLTGGDDVKRGLSFNPATWQNIFSGYTGGFGTVALGVSDLVLDILSGEDGDMPVSRYPLLSRFLTGGDKDLKLSRMNSIYNKKVVDFVSEMDHDYKGYLEKSMDPSINILDRAEYIVKLEKFMKSDDFKKSQELSQYVRAISDMERFLREVGSDNDSLENQVYELKLRALEIFEDSDE